MPKRSERVESGQGNDVLDPRFQSFELFRAKVTADDEGFIRDSQVVEQVSRPVLQRERAESFADRRVVEIPRHLALEVAQEVVRAALLKQRGLVMQDAPAIRPEDSLYDEAAPDVGYPEGAGA